MSAITTKSNKSRSSNSSRCTTPKPEPKTDCERRRLAIERLERQDIIINGYKRYMLQERTNNKEQSVAYYSLEEALQETLEAKEQLATAKPVKAEFVNYTTDLKDSITCYAYDS
ncbi:hypothetical protein TNIN_328101 [Trichonephila inaurata madagascariensis]|uniref:Uncharacterized protein n=1 Tax=Trichonephila inaurata madagascariensis TaxID=2747483 RepID=A0A8X6WZ15_9ARAC|nr:hypothetical protein TNIN_328101 [Trichonephila inaurata madagascariensis]